MNINYCVIVIFTYMKRKNIARGLGPVTKVQPEIKVILDEKGPSGNTDQGTISWFHITKLEMWDKAHIMQLITFVRSTAGNVDPRWPDLNADNGRRQVTQSHRSIALISCYWPLNATGLLENSQILILKSILINRGLNQWSLTAMPSKLWMSVLICTIFTKSNVCACLCFFACCGLRWIKIVNQKSNLY